MIGFVGCGNMAQAMISGIIDSGLYKPDEIIASRRDEEKLSEIKDRFGINTTVDNQTVARTSDILILAVKPYQYETVIHEIKNEISDETLIISIAAGQTIDSISDMFGREVRVIRTMPNTPALVGEGATGMCFAENIGSEDADKAKKIFESFGVVTVVDESLMDVIVGVSGSSPAYIYMIIEAMADAAVSEGLPRDEAYRLAAQSVMGTAKMVLETKEHPGVLKDRVCSPGGTTMAGVRLLEERGLRGTIMEGICAGIYKSMELSEEE